MVYTTLLVGSIYILKNGSSAIIDVYIRSSQRLV